MFQNLGFDPKMIADEPLTPTMSQLEEVRQELHKIEGISKIPENDYVKYKGYISKLADDLEQTPMYKVAPVRDVVLRPGIAQPDVLDITYKGRPLVGDIQTKVVGDSLIVRQLAVDDPSVMSRKFLLSVSESLEDVAREKGLTRLKIEFFPRHRKMYEAAGFRVARVELEPGFMVRDIPPLEYLLGQVLRLGGLRKNPP